MFRMVGWKVEGGMRDDVSFLIGVILFCLLFVRNGL